MSLLHLIPGTELVTSLQTCQALSRKRILQNERKQNYWALLGNTLRTDSIRHCHRRAWLLALYKMNQSQIASAGHCRCLSLSPPREKKGLNHPKALLGVRASGTGVSGAPLQRRRCALGAGQGEPASLPPWPKDQPPSLNAPGPA